MLYGVDVHGGYQAGLDWPTLRRQGYTFAAVKASQGTNFVGPQFAAWVKAGRAAGLIMGAYHWIEHGNVSKQVNHFLDVLATVGGPDGLLIQLDCEDSATWDDLQEWDRLWSERTGGHPYLVYTGAWWWGATGRRWDGSSLTPLLWHSHYLTADTDGLPDDPAAFAARIPSDWWAPGYGGWKAATILQFTSKGDAGGLRNNLDLNATRLTREQLLALTRPPATAAATQEDDMALTPDEAKALTQAATSAHDAAVRSQDALTRVVTQGEKLDAMAADLAAIKAALNSAPPAASVTAGQIVDELVRRLGSAA